MWSDRGASTCAVDAMRVIHIERNRFDIEVCTLVITGAAPLATEGLEFHLPFPGRRRRRSSRKGTDVSETSGNRWVTTRELRDDASRGSCEDIRCFLAVVRVFILVFGFLDARFTGAGAFCAVTGAEGIGGEFGVGVTFDVGVSSEANLFVATGIDERGL